MPLSTVLVSSFTGTPWTESSRSILCGGLPPCSSAPSSPFSGTALFFTSPSGSSARSSGVDSVETCGSDSPFG
eukprot:2886242-Rhodomonas_salina.1